MITDDIVFDKKLTTDIVSQEKLSKILTDPGFGKYFTDHMVSIEYNPIDNWCNPMIIPFSPISLSPSTLVLHYGQEIFEGLKAYKSDSGQILTFRPEQNANRFVNSARRMNMPPLPPDLFLQAISEYLKVDKRWVPDSNTGKSLYIRPLMFSDAVGIGPTSGSTYRFLLYGTPVSDYETDGKTAIKVWITHDYVRAVVGGTGMVKCGGNYAASMIGYHQAKENGCSQVLWLDAIEKNYLEELGAMNLFMVENSGVKSKLVTPELNGSILPGITRDSVLELAKSLDIETQTRKISLTEFYEGISSGTISEVFGCGTAALITSVGEIRSDTVNLKVADGKPGIISKKLRNLLWNIQTGKQADIYNWVHPIDID